MEPDDPETIPMKKIRGRARRARPVGLEAAHAPLEGRLLLAASWAEVGSASPVGTWARGGAALVSAARAGSGAVEAAPAGFDFQPQALVAGGGVADGYGSTSYTVAPPVPPPLIVTTAEPGGPLSLSYEPGFGPSGPVALTRGVEGGLSAVPFGPQAVFLGEGGEPERSVVHLLAYHPVDPAAMGILPVDPLPVAATMASIIGDSAEVDVEVVDAPPAPAQAVNRPGPHAFLPPRPVVSDAPTPAWPDTPAPAETVAPVAGEPAPAGVAPAGPAEESSSSSEGEEARPAEPPGPIGVGLRLAAPLIDAAGWDEALGRLVEGADDLLDGLGTLGDEATYVPWIVAAGVALGASEAARRARSRPKFAAAFVDGSVSVVDPEAGPGSGAVPRGATLSDSVRRLLARGLSRWTTRR